MQVCTALTRGRRTTRGALHGRGSVSPGRRTEGWTTPSCSFQQDLVCTGRSGRCSPGGLPVAPCSSHRSEGSAVTPQPIPTSDHKNGPLETMSLPPSSAKHGGNERGPGGKSERRQAPWKGVMQCSHFHMVCNWHVSLL